MLVKALERADVVVVPARVGGVETSRVSLVLDMIPPKVPAGLVLCSARTYTRDYIDAEAGWTEDGVRLHRPQAHRDPGPGVPAPDGLEVYRTVSDEPHSQRALTPRIGTPTGRQPTPDYLSSQIDRISARWLSALADQLQPAGDVTLGTEHHEAVRPKCRLNAFLLSRRDRRRWRHGLSLESRSSMRTVTVSPSPFPIALRISALIGNMWVPSPSAMNELRIGWLSVPHLDQAPGPEELD